MYFYKMDYASFLRRHIEEIIPLTDEEFEAVYDCFVPLTVEKKTYLIRTGQQVLFEFLVVKGCLKTFALDDADNEYIIQFATENWWVSDYPAYMQQASAELSVQALESGVVLRTTLEKRNAMCEKVPKMNIFLGRKALGGYMASQKRVLSLLRNSAKEKYELLLAQYPELFQRLPRKTIAHYLGVSRETLSRLEKKK